MEERREQEKFRVVNPKSASPLADAAFAQNQNLVAASERIDDHGPFFESDSHGESVVGRSGFGNVAAGL